MDTSVTSLNESSQSQTRSGRGKLEELSKEELISFLKKKLAELKKYKDRCEELENQLAQTTNSLEKPAAQPQTECGSQTDLLEPPPPASTSTQSDPPPPSAHEEQQAGTGFMCLNETASQTLLCGLTADSQEVGAQIGAPSSFATAASSQTDDEPTSIPEPASRAEAEVQTVDIQAPSEIQPANAESVKISAESADSTSQTDAASTAECGEQVSEEKATWASAHTQTEPPPVTELSAQTEDSPDPALAPASAPTARAERDTQTDAANASESREMQSEMSAFAVLDCNSQTEESLARAASNEAESQTPAPSGDADAGADAQACPVLVEEPRAARVECAVSTEDLPPPPEPEPKPDVQAVAVQTRRARSSHVECQTDDSPAPARPLSDTSVQTDASPQSTVALTQTDPPPSATNQMQTEPAPSAFHGAQTDPPPLFEPHETQTDLPPLFEPHEAQTDPPPLFEPHEAQTDPPPLFEPHEAQTDPPPLFEPHEAQIDPPPLFEPHEAQTDPPPLFEPHETQTDSVHADCSFVQTDDWCVAIEQSIRRELNAEMDRRLNDFEELQSKYDTLKAQHEQIVKDLQQTVESQRQKIEEIERLSSQRGMMDLELADFESTTATLRAQFEEQTRQLNERSQSNAEAEAIAESLRVQLAEANEARSQIEERAAKLKQVLLKNKKELAEARKKIEEAQQSEQQLREQINVFKQLLDGKEVELSSHAEVISQLQASIRASQEASLERDAAHEKERLAQSEVQKRLEEEIAAARQEFDSYKTRAQSILKHQQLAQESATTSGSIALSHPSPSVSSTAPGPPYSATVATEVGASPSSASVALKVNTLQKEVEDARAQLALHVEECTHLRTENDRLSAETERWKTKYAQALHECTNRESTLKQQIEVFISEKSKLEERLERAQTAISRFSQDKDDTMDKLKQQSALLSQSESECVHLRALADELRTRLEQTQQQLDQMARPVALHAGAACGGFMPISAEPAEDSRATFVENEPDLIRREPSHLLAGAAGLLMSAPGAQAASLTSPPPALSSGAYRDVVSLDSSASAPSGIRPIPLDQLLQTGPTIAHTQSEAQQRAFDPLPAPPTVGSAMRQRSYSPSESLISVPFASRDSTSAYHYDQSEQSAYYTPQEMEQLLADNESNVERLMEQAKVLKEEVRRLERNQEREKHLANMEYLKNIILKYLTLRAGEERVQLVPVLSTLLRLNADEQTVLRRTATVVTSSPNGPPAQGAAPAPGGVSSWFGGYLTGHQ